MLVNEVLPAFKVLPVQAVASVFQATTVHEVLQAELVPMVELVNPVHEVWKVLLVHLALTASLVNPVTPVPTANALSATVSCLLDTLKPLLTHLAQSALRKFGTVSHSCTCLVTTMLTSKILDLLALVCEPSLPCLTCTAV